MDSINQFRKLKEIRIRFPMMGLCMLISAMTFGQNVGINIVAPVGKLHVKGSEDISQLIIDANTVQANTHPVIKLRKSTGTDLMWIHSDDSTNVFIGLKAGKSNVTGVQTVNNSFIGSRAGYSNTYGYDNTGIGTNALYANTDGSRNTATGSGALYSNTYATNNTASGYKAMYFNTSGAYNTATGSNALYANVSGELNSAFGARSLEANTNGYSNTATGASALQNNTIGNENTANGSLSQYSNTSGYQNTAVGYSALFSNSTGIINTACGWKALYANTNGYFNTATGGNALASNVAGNNNAGLGYSALFSNTSGSNNAAFGYTCLYLNTTGGSNSAYGTSAMYANNSGYENTAIGSGALSGNTSGYSNTSIGASALIFEVGGHNNIAIGPGSGTGQNSPNIINTVSIGNHGYLNGANNQAFIGNLSTNWIGGQTNWFTYSDARVKNNVAEDVKGLDFIERLRPVTYHLDITAMREITGNEDTEDYPGKYDGEKIKQSGFLAQEVEQAAIASGYDFSGITIPKKDNQLYTMSYAQFVVPLVKAAQELAAKNESQDSEIETLKAENELLLQRLEKLELLLSHKE